MVARVTWLSAQDSRTWREDDVALVISGANNCRDSGSPSRDLAIRSSFRTLRGSRGGTLLVLVAEAILILGSAKVCSPRDEKKTKSHWAWSSMAAFLCIDLFDHPVPLQLSLRRAWASAFDVRGCLVVSLLIVRGAN